MALTDQQVKNAKGSAKTVKLSDGGGLQLWITPAGGKLWALAYRFDGKQKKLSFGSYPEISLKRARELRGDARVQLAAEIDPGQQRKANKAARRESQANTFDKWADALLDKKRRAGRAENTLEKNRFLLNLARPALGSRPIADISAKDVLSVLNAVNERGANASALKLRATLGEVFRLAGPTAGLEVDPTAILKGQIEVRPAKNHAALTEPKEFGRLLRAVGVYQGRPETRLALQILALTFARPGELRAAAWSEFDLDKAVWTIPAERAKMRRPHIVPLSRQSLAVLAELRRFTGRGKLLFPSLRGASRPMSENTLNFALRNMGFDKDEATSHGFRASAATMLHKSRNFSVDEVERALAHVQANKIKGIYDREEHLEVRADIMQFWADELDRMRQGAEVVALKRA